MNTKNNNGLRIDPCGTKPLLHYSQVWPLAGRQLFSDFMIVSNKYNKVQKIGL